MDYRAIAGFLFLALVAVSCSGGGMRLHPSSIDDRPPMYIKGWEDGCRTGHGLSAGADHRYTRDDRQYRENPLYHSGWDDAFEVCQTAYGNNFDPVLDAPLGGSW